MTPRLHSNYRTALGARRLMLGMERSTEHRRLDADQWREHSTVAALAWTGAAFIFATAVWAYQDVLRELLGFGT